MCLQLAVAEQGLALQVMYSLDTVTLRHVASSLSDLDARAHALLEAAKAEVQRRGAALQDYTPVLPPHVTAILTAGDKVRINESQIFSNFNYMNQGHLKSVEMFLNPVESFYNFPNAI